MEEKNAKKQKKLWFDTDIIVEGDESETIATLESKEINKEKPENGLVKEEKKEDNSIDLNKYSSVEELESVGLDKLKQELQRLGLLCGWSLKERAQRLYSIKGKDIGSIDPKLFAKKKKWKFVVFHL